MHKLVYEIILIKSNTFILVWKNYLFSVHQRYNNFRQARQACLKMSTQKLGRSSTLSIPFKQFKLATATFTPPSKSNLVIPCFILYVLSTITVNYVHLVLATATFFKCNVFCQNCNFIFFHPNSCSVGTLNMSLFASLNELVLLVSPSEQQQPF